MSSIGTNTWWCPRCGTLKLGNDFDLPPPFLVDRIKAFRDAEDGRFSYRQSHLWNRLGIQESIDLPENRKPLPPAD